MKNICIIPARAGSRRIPNKNIKPFLGKPVICYSIQAAQDTGLFERVVVSTDSDEIGSLAAQAGAIYYKRKPELCWDSTPMVEVVLDVLESLCTSALEYEFVCMVYACAPLIRSERISEGFRIMREGYSSCFPVYRDKPIERTLLIRDGRVFSRFPEFDTKPSNDWPECYQHAGQFFWGRIPMLMIERCWMMANAAAILLSPREAQDIDELEDWEQAEMKYKAMGER